MAIPRIQPGYYPAILSYGFRPFFLLGAFYAGAAILFWLPLFYGILRNDSAFAPVDWHVHEMLFGYLAAIMTGFLLTAIPNWTGRLPVQGRPLLALVLLWLAGRFAVFFSAGIGWLAASVIDCAFLLAVAGAAGVEIVVGRNWRNLKMLAPVSMFFVANVVFHLEAHAYGMSDIGRRLGIAAAIILITIVGGRIIPSFTRNWLARENPGRLPRPFGSFDTAVIAATAIALAAWTFRPEAEWVGAVLIASAVLNLSRIARWAGERALRDPLVLVLHVAFLFVPAGLMMAGLAAIFPRSIPMAAVVHTFGAGAIGLMTLAVMTRATLGHTGRELHANAGTCGIYVAVGLAAVLRVLAAFLPEWPALIDASALLWAAAFLGYAGYYGGMLARPRRRSRQPIQS
jgi:uncharacterized protein involved in response to NO